MARRFGPDQPFLGVRTDPSEWTHLSVPYKFEDIAAVFAKKIRSYQPEGPVLHRRLLPLRRGGLRGRPAVAGRRPGSPSPRRVLFAEPGALRVQIVASVQFAAAVRAGEIPPWKSSASCAGSEFSQYAKDRMQGLMEKLRPPTVQNGPSEQFLPELEEIGAAAAHNYRPSPSPYLPWCFVPPKTLEAATGIANTTGRL